MDRRRSQDHDLLIEIKVKLDSFLQEMRSNDGQLANRLTVVERDKVDKALFDDHLKEKDKLVASNNTQIQRVFDQMALIEASRNKLIGALIVVQVVSSFVISLIIKKFIN